MAHRKNKEKSSTKKPTGDRHVVCFPRPPTLSQRHMDLRVWSDPHPRHSYIFQVSSKFVQGFRSPIWVEVGPFPLLWLLAFTTARRPTTVQAVIRSLLLELRIIWSRSV